MITLPNVKIKANRWVNLYNMSTILTSVQTLPGVAAINLQVLDGSGLLYCISADEPTVDHGYRVLQPLETFENVSTDPGLWVYAQDEDVNINFYPIGVAVSGFNIIPEIIEVPVINGSCRVGSTIDYTPATFHRDGDSTVTTKLYVDGVIKPINYVFTAADFSKIVQIEEICTFVAAFGSGTFIASGLSKAVKVLKALS